LSEGLGLHQKLPPHSSFCLRPKTAPKTGAADPPPLWRTRPPSSNTAQTGLASVSSRYTWPTGAKLGDIRSAAVKLSISYETPRSQLKNIFNKTGPCRQAAEKYIGGDTLELPVLNQRLARRWQPAASTRPS